MFAAVSQASKLQQALNHAASNTVIQVMQNISFTALPTALPIKGGVTIRGDRRRTLLGPQLSLLVDSGVVPQASPQSNSLTAFLEGLGTRGVGASPLIHGNTFLENVHSITADGSSYSRYAAWDNLLLSTLIGANIDMHGSGPDHDGGVGGAGAEVLRNTFRDTQYPNFPVRGYPCNGGLDVFRGNVALQPLASAIEWQGGGAVPPSYMRIDSRFSVPDLLSNSAQILPVGDFDGDHKDDLFLATGAAWYYAPAANAEWRFLSTKTDTINSLLFGDFDGDGRTDVFTQVGDNWMVSLGGVPRGKSSRIAPTIGPLRALVTALIRCWISLSVTLWATTARTYFTRMARIGMCLTEVWELSSSLGHFGGHRGAPATKPSGHALKRCGQSCRS